MHEKYLLAALKEAELGQGACAPNPSVGAVAVKNGEIIARAWHRGAGTPHAERVLIETLPANETGVTLYVTLEPCNHHGRTPPCVDAIVNYGFEKVVFAYRDPNPIVAANDTSSLLSSCGVSVEHIAISEIDVFYQAYSFWTKTGRPWVTAKIAQTFDGKIARPNGEPIILSNACCSGFTHKNRLGSDIILTTARTVNQDNPQLNVRLPELTCAKPVAIIDTRLNLNPASTILSTATHCHIFYDERIKHPAQVDNRTYHPVPVVGDLLDLDTIMQTLGRLGYHSVWLEAGGILFSAMHKARLVQRTHVYLVPLILGPNAVSAYCQDDLFGSSKHISWMPMRDNMIATLDWEHKGSQWSSNRTI